MNYKYQFSSPLKKKTISISKSNNTWLGRKYTYESGIFLYEELVNLVKQLSLLIRHLKNEHFEVIVQESITHESLRKLVSKDKNLYKEDMKRKERYKGDRVRKY